jgi:hypothetical protein
MNEKIKELAIAAKVEHCISHVRLQDFAEHIIKECANIVENMSPGYNDYRNQIEDAFRRDCVELIKHRFGIVDQKDGELK